MPYREESVEALWLRRAAVEAELGFVEALIRRHRRQSLRARIAGAPWLLMGTFASVSVLFAFGFVLATLPRLGGSRIQQARTDAQSLRGATEMYLAQSPGAGVPDGGDPGPGANPLVADPNARSVGVEVLDRLRGRGRDGRVAGTRSTHGHR